MAAHHRPMKDDTSSSTSLSTRHTASPAGHRIEGFKASTVTLARRARHYLELGRKEIVRWIAVHLVHDRPAVVSYDRAVTSFASFHSSAACKQV